MATDHTTTNEEAASGHLYDEQDWLLDLDPFLHVPPFPLPTALFLSRAP